MPSEPIPKRQKTSSVSSSDSISVKNLTRRIDHLLNAVACLSERIDLLEEAVGELMDSEAEYTDDENTKAEDTEAAV